MKFFKLFSKEEKILTESELLTAYKQTDEIRFVSELYHPYMQMVFTICFKYLKDSQESEDAVMNIFEKLMDATKVCSLGQITAALFEVGGQYRRNM